ncbi:MAG TPA: PIN domain-containing protein [Solirubrobacterales bacterium]|nr:PIN domain-containing protein [Solirubrobacterales bacterium]
MARLILDTSVLIEAERGEGGLLEAVEDVDDLAMSAVTVAELRVGVGLTKGRRQRENHELFIASVLDAISVEAYDVEVAEAHAQLMAHVRRAGTPRGAHDLIIAATALARDRKVVTLDRRGFADLPGVAVAELG